LPSGALEVNDEHARDAYRRFAATVFLDERQSEVDSGRDAGR